MPNGQSVINSRILELRKKTEISNIVLENENDWLNKLGVSIDWNYAEWGNILNAIAVKYPFASIMVVNSAFDKLKQSENLLLPNFLDIYNTDANNKYNLHIRMNGKNIVNSNSVVSAELTLCYSQWDIVQEWNSKLNYIFKLVLPMVEYLGGDIVYNVPLYWSVNKSIQLFEFNNDTPLYNSFVLPHNIKIGDKLQIEFTIANFPLLNPIRQSSYTDYKDLIINTDGVVVSRNGNWVVDLSFNKSCFGKDTINDVEYKLIYNGDITYKFTDNLNNTSTMSFKSGMVWVQIYVKSLDDLTYTMTHRETTIGNQYCYVNSIKLLP